MNQNNSILALVSTMVDFLVQEQKIPKDLAQHFQGEFKNIIAQRIGVELLSYLTTEQINKLAQEVQKSSLSPQEAVFLYFKNNIPNVEEKIINITQEVLDGVKV